jgi:hypothetical protein
MSSHHFVKEGQEPAFIIYDALSLELAGSILEWSPTVIVVGTALEQALRWEIKIDAVVCEDDDEQAVREKLEDQMPVTVLITSSAAQMLPTALHYLVNQEQRSAYIMAESAPGVMELCQPYLPALQIDIIQRHFRWFTPARHHFRKWLPASAMLELKKTVDDQSLTMHGVKNEGNRLQTLEDGIVDLISDRPFWLGEPL